MYPRHFPRLSYSYPPVFQPRSSHLLWFIILSILLFLSPQGVFAQGAIRILSHQFSPDDITIGDPVQLRLQIEADENLHIYPDPLDDSEHEHLEMDKPQVKQITSEESSTGKARYEITYPLRAFATGAHTLPSITVKYTDVDGHNGSIQTPTYPFEVRSVKAPSDTEMKGIKGPWSVPRNWFVFLLAVSLVIIVVGVLIFFYLRRRAQPLELQPETVPQRQPHEIAYEQLDRIEELNLVAQGEMKTYHTEIAHVIRQYIAARYHIPALELTTQELLDRLQTEDISREVVQQFFTNCDLVKFARYSPTKPEAHERLEEARRIVDETKQLGVTVGEEQKNGIRENL